MKMSHNLILGHFLCQMNGTVILCSDIRNDKNNAKMRTSHSNTQITELLLPSTGLWNACIFPSVKWMKENASISPFKMCMISWQVLHAYLWLALEPCPITFSTFKTISLWNQIQLSLKSEGKCSNPGFIKWFVNVIKASLAFHGK